MPGRRTVASLIALTATACNRSDALSPPLPMTTDLAAPPVDLALAPLDLSASVTDLAWSWPAFDAGWPRCDRTSEPMAFIDGTTPAGAFQGRAAWFSIWKGTCAVDHEIYITPEPHGTRDAGGDLQGRVLVLGVKIGSDDPSTLIWEMADP